MIITCKKEVPFRWIFFAILPWTVFTFNGGIMNVCFIFSLKKFVENPAGLTFVMSLPGFVSIVLVPVVNFLSDRIWTRFGRRKPFVVSGWLGLGICLVLMPLVPNFWTLLAVYLAFCFFNDIGGKEGPMEPLVQEIVPPHQRGHSQGVQSWCGNIVSMTFYFVALGRFDDVSYMAGVPLAGEKAIYWVAAMLLSVVVVFIMLGIKEVDQKSALVGQRLSVRNFFTSILDRELWPVFTLIFGYAMLNSGLGALGNLLYTDQWGYSKQMMGTNVMIGGVINLFVIGFLILIADKLNRMKAYQALITIALAVKVIYYLYVSYLIPDRRPSLIEMVVFGEALSIVGILTGMLYTPLVYDYVTRNKMGTYMAGAGMLSRVTQIITINGVGLFIWGFTALFQPPAGDMVRTVLRSDSKKAEVEALAANAPWTYPQNGAPVPAASLHASAWYGTGLVFDSGNCWELRLSNKDSERLAGEKDSLTKEKSPLVAKEKMEREAAALLRSQNNPAAAEPKEREADAKKNRIAKIDARVAEIDAELLRRADNLRQQAVRNFGDRILVDGQQIIDLAPREALVLEVPVTERPNGRILEKILTDLRLERPDVIDLRPVKRDTGYSIAVSSLIEPGRDETSVARDLQTSIASAVTKRDAKLLGSLSTPASTSLERAVSMKLMIVEEPLDTRISPITRVVNWILSFFDNAPAPGHRLAAIARSLRVPGQTDHVRVEPGADNSKTMTVVALIRPEAPGSATLGDDAVGQRLVTLLAATADGTKPELSSQIRAFYDRIENAAAAQRLTVARPFVATSYAPMKYDYMCGYIWMFLMASIGLVITFGFVRREKRGLIHKRGVEESLAGTEQSASQTSTASGPRIGQELFTPVFYTPGRAGYKLLMMFIGMALFAFGLNQLWTPLRLLCTGERAIAEATRVIKAKAGLPDQILTDDLQIRAKEEIRDRSYTFWNEFRFHAGEGREITMRSPIGSQLKPLYPLLDEDGLPSSVTIYHDARQPELVSFPAAFSTWFVPGMIVIIGLICTVTGAMLFYWAKKPIELPHIVTTAETPPWPTPGAG